MKRYAFLIIKIFLLAAFIVFVGLHTKSWNIVGLGLLEFIAIFCFQGLIPGKNRFLRVIKYLLTSLLLFLSLANLTVYLFSGTFVSYLMTSNTENLSAISSSIPLYVTAIVYIVIAAFFPMRLDFEQVLPSIFEKMPKLIRNRYFFFTVLLAISLLIWIPTNLYGRLKTPVFAYTTYLHEAVKMSNLRSDNVSNKELKAIEKEFRHETIDSGINTPQNSMNVIIVFAEGFSSEVMSYDGGKLTPQLNQFSAETDNFINYFNQTAATYKGVRGQLFSSQQFDNGYENGSSKIKQNLETPLTSVQSILADYGYQTEFFNPEPNAEVWADYVSNLGFQKVLSSSTPSKAEESYVDDQRNFQKLFSEAEKLNDSGQPFMLATYTFGTHFSLDDSKTTYGDGKNALLNKFHNMDKSFGEFWSKFKKSELADNTMVIFTSDHATFPDAQYRSTFNTGRSYFLSTIPLMIYYPEIQPQTFDAKSRNTLGLAPTILDLIGVSKAENYFLGTSLYLDEPTSFEFITDLSPAYYGTKDVTEQEVRENKDLTSQDVKTLDKLQDFYKLSLNE
jgi:phosphoglycerol transferase MdoB-like AlkP superfamily enzyme